MGKKQKDKLYHTKASIKKSVIVENIIMVVAEELGLPLSKERAYYLPNKLFKEIANNWWSDPGDCDGSLETGDLFWDCDADISEEYMTLIELAINDLNKIDLNISAWVHALGGTVGDPTLLKLLLYARDNNKKYSLKQKEMFGYYLDKESGYWVAFDNRTGHCNVEDMLTQKQIKKWLFQQ